MFDTKELKIVFVRHPAVRDRNPRDSCEIRDRACETLSEGRKVWKVYTLLLLRPRIFFPHEIFDTVRRKRCGSRMLDGKKYPFGRLDLSRVGEREGHFLFSTLISELLFPGEEEEEGEEKWLGSKSNGETRSLGGTTWRVSCLIC